MKLNCFYWVILLALIFFGCTNNEEEDIQGQQPVSKRDAYTSVTIKLPVVGGTRASTPAHADGEAKEYAVKDLTLLFFRAPDGVEENEDDFVLSEFLTTLPALQVYPGGGALNVTLPSGTSTTTDGITQTFSTDAIPIDKTSSRVLAILNLKGAFVSMGGALTGLLKVGNTFKNINNAIQLVSIADLTGDENGFLMLSEPVWDTSAGRTVTLTKITPGSKESAVTNKSYVNVERAVAKVTLAVNETNYTQKEGDVYSSFEVADGSHKGDKIEILGWLLGNTNQSTYPFRKVDKEWATGFTSVWNNGILSGKHVYWAEDPNYKDRGSDASPFNNPVLETATWNNFTVGTATPSSGVYNEYCFENTCNYDIMYKANVTRLIIKAKYYPNSSNQIGGNNTSDNDGTWWSFTSVAAHYSQKHLFRQIALWITSHKGALDFPANLDDGNSIDAAEGSSSIQVTTNADGISATLSSTNGSWSIALEKSGTNHYNLDALSYKSNTAGSETVTMDAALKTTFQNQVGEIQKYDRGICYYEAFIRHFTNEEGGYDTSWSIGNDGYGVQQLGRYGLVRNNWYKLTLNSIKQPGEPTIPDDKEVPVDTETAYIDCDISIVAWALREHGIDL